MKTMTQHNRFRRSLIYLLSLGIPVLIIIAVFSFRSLITHPIDNPPEPVFHLLADLPIGKGTTVELTSQPGTHSLIPVTIQSNRDKPLEIQLTISRTNSFPANITFDMPEHALTLPAREIITLEINCDIGETVEPGLYHAFIMGNIQEPIDNQGGIALPIDFIVTERDEL